MNIEAKLIEILNQPGIHSGNDIGDQLGISRVAVKKRISVLADQGLPVEAIKGKGYRLRDTAELLSNARIIAVLEPGVKDQIGNLEIHRKLPSTNTYLQSSGDSDAGLARIVLAESQPEGKGRRGRGWSSTPYRNLLMSVGWRYEHWPSSPAALSLAFAVAVHQSIVSAGAGEAMIKWPNDVLLNGKKVAGLLVDANGEASGACDLVFGVGINFFIAAADAKTIDQDWDHLSSVKGVNLSRNTMAARIISNLIESLCLYETEGFSPFVDYWNENAAYVGQKVRLFNKDLEHRGELLGVDHGGELLLKDDLGSELRFTQADISLRPLD